MPEVTVTAAPATVAEGSPVLFRLTAAPAPTSALEVNVRWSTEGSFLTGSRPTKVTIPTSGTAEVTVTTHDDSTDEPDGSVTVAVNAGSGYTVGTPSEATAAITDNDDDDDGTATPGRPATPVVKVEVEEEDSASVPEGTVITFTFTATPAPRSALKVNVRWFEKGSFLTGSRPRTVTIPTSGRAEVAVTTDDDSTDEPDGSVTATVNTGSGYTVGTPSEAIVAITDDDVTPSVSVAASATSVEEGESITFTFTATPAPVSDLTVNVNWSSTGSFLTGSRPRTVTIPTSGRDEVVVTTHDDSTDEPNGSVTATVRTGSGYNRGTPAFARATITDNDLPPSASVAADRTSVVRGGSIIYTFTVEPAPESTVTATLQWSSVSARAHPKPETIDIPTSGTTTHTVTTTSHGSGTGSIRLDIRGVSSGRIGSPSMVIVLVTQ